MYYAGQKFTIPFTSAGIWNEPSGVDYYNKDTINWTEMITHDYTLDEDPNKPAELV